MKREFNKKIAREIDCAVRELTAGAFEKALSILRKYRSQLGAGCEAAARKRDADT